MKLTSHSFIEKLKSGTELFIEKIEEINSINYFPVIDHDTGDNIYSTLSKALTNSKDDVELVDNLILYSKGNSGIILGRALSAFLSTIINKGGFFKDIDFKEGVENARREAYNAVLHPKDKTILTFLDVIADNDIWVERKKVVEVMNQALQATLRDGEYDAGAKGLYYLIEFTFSLGLNRAIAINSQVNIVEENNLKYKYCTELILEAYQMNTIEVLLEKLNTLGDSIAYSLIGKSLKLHIHSNNPFEVFSLAEKYGVILYKKIDNMSLEGKDMLKLVYIVDDNGELFSPFKKFNVEYISTSEYGGELEHKMKSIKAERVILLTNNPEHFKESYDNLTIIKTYGLSSKVSVLLCNTSNSCFLEDMVDFAMTSKALKISNEQLSDLFTYCTE